MESNHEPHDTQDAKLLNGPSTTVLQNCFSIPESMHRVCHASFQLNSEQNINMDFKLFIYDSRVITASQHGTLNMRIQQADRRRMEVVAVTVAETSLSLLLT